VAAKEPRGVVYTRPWVADLILDLAGYRADEDLAARYAVEPSAGEGAFLVPMVRRLLASLTVHGRKLSDARESIHAYELDADSAARAAQLVGRELREHGASMLEAREVAEGWVSVGDYLLASPPDRRADLVVGNPPYIRYDDLPAQALSAYRRLYPAMVGRCDIYVGFIEAGLRQLKDGGVLGLICADRWMRSAYGAELRRMITSAFGVEAVIEMHDAPAFEDVVAAYPAVIVIRRAPQRTVTVASAGPGAGPLPDGGSLADRVARLARGRVDAVPGFAATMVDRWFRGTAPWPSLQPRQLGLLQRLEARFGPLEDDLTGTKVGIGVATGADRVYITTDPDVAEPDRVLPLAMTADTRHGADAATNAAIEAYGITDLAEVRQRQPHQRELPRRRPQFPAVRRRRRRTCSRLHQRTPLAVTQSQTRASGVVYIWDLCIGVVRLLEREGICDPAP